MFCAGLLLSIADLLACGRFHSPAHFSVHEPAYTNSLFPKLRTGPGNGGKSRQKVDALFTGSAFSVRTVVSTIRRTSPLFNRELGQPLQMPVSSSTAGVHRDLPCVPLCPLW